MKFLRTSGWALYTFIGTWAIALNVLVGALMVGHWVTLPRPVVGSQLPIAGLNSEVVSTDPKASSLRVYHVLLEDCPCSQRILRHLAARDPLTECQEAVLLVGGTAGGVVPEHLARYRVQRLTLQQLNSEYGVESAPMMMAIDADHQVLYAGGYTSRKQGPDIRDVEIIQSLIAGRSVEPLPVYGCAASKRLQQMLDPLGLKY